MSHVNISTLVDYWAGELAADAVVTVEEHAFECDDCGRRFAAFGEVAHGIASVVGRTGGVDLILTRSLVDQLTRAGVVLREYHARFGDVIACTVGARDDLLVTYLEADLSGVENPTLTLSTGDQLLRRQENVPIDRAANQLIYALPGDVARTFPSMKIVARLYDGDRLVGESIFDHTAFSV